MIDINLIPPALRKNSKGQGSAVALNIPKEILVGVGVGVVLLLVLVHLLLGAVWMVQYGHLSVSKLEWDKLSSDKGVLDKIYEDTKIVKTKYSLMAGLTIQKAVYWSPKFNAISDALSRGLWLRRMVLDKVDLSMDGSVVSKSQNEIANVGLFLTALKQNDEFMKDFTSLEVNSIQRDKNNTVEVTDFTVMAKLK